MTSFNFVTDKLTYTSDSISINKFSLSIAGKNLFIDSPLTISPGNIYGLIGKNGCGKTSLLKQLALNKLFSDSKIRVLYVEQELEMGEKNPVEFIFESNVKLAALSKEVDELDKLLENEELEDEEYEKLSEKQRALQTELSGYNKESDLGKIKSILIGLGFTRLSMEQSCLLFSGGWRMRISLARTLYLEPDLLLLDEPTNHLDLEAIIWLSNYMETWKGVAIIVSHNIGFLNDVCSHILNIEHHKLVTYKGNYKMFKLSLKQKLKEEEKAYDAYEKKLKDVRKKATGKNSVDEFIKKNEINKPEKPYEVHINFLPVSHYKSHVIKVEDVTFSYEDKLILKDVNIGIDMTTRATLVGPNGSGKSTFMKLIIGEIKPQCGSIWMQNGLRIGYYNQHFEEQLPLDITPIDFLKNMVPKDLIESDREKTVRAYLGKVKLEGSAHNKLIRELSGGQKARVAFINLIFHQPQVLLLDEPTNHLDIETVEGLIEGLQGYEGGIVLITHEPEMINALESELWIMDSEKKVVERSKNTYEEYSQTVLAKILG
jgi:ATP-binding cassette subfamily F protein 1